MSEANSNQLVGKSHTPEWEAWRAMRKRCYSPNTHNFERYGGRGITVCDRWRESFQNFFADLGPRPSKRHSLHRKNNDGNYEPENCEWALPNVQAANRGKPRKGFIKPTRDTWKGDRPYNFTDLIGKVFGRWTVISYHGCIKQKGHWFCRCSCGAERIVKGDTLKNGRSKSCGCLHKEMIGTYARTILKRKNTQHGKSRSREYASWNQMLQRCHNPKNPTYKRYGAIGVTVCQRWRDGFEAFLSDVGQCPTEEHTIDRIDVFGNYEPGNVRWATDEEQRLNQRRTRRFEYQGRRITIPELARIAGIGAATMRSRLVNHGWSVERAMTTDPKDYHSKKD